MPSTKPEPVNTGTPTLTATPTTPDTTDSGETEQQQLDRLNPVGPDTRPDALRLYTTLRPGRQPTEDEWREYHARRRDEEWERDHAQRVLKADREHRVHADGTVYRCQSAGRGDRPLRRVRDSAAGAHLAAESDGARSEIVPENPADYLLDEAPPVDAGRPGSQRLPARRIRRPTPAPGRLLADSDPAHARSYLGHPERRGAGQSHGTGDGGVLDALTCRAAWLQGHWDRRVVDPVKRRWPVEDAPANRYNPAQAGQLAAFMPGYSIDLESSYMAMSPTERRDFAADLMRETPVISGLAVADTAQGWEKAAHLGGAAIELPWLHGPGRGVGIAARSFRNVRNATDPGWHTSVMPGAFDKYRNLGPVGGSGTVR